MPLTPADVRNVIFSKPSIGEPGYHEGEVDDFLDLVHAELTRLMEENNDLRSQLEQLDQRLRAVPVDTGCNSGTRQPTGSVMTPLRPPIREQTSSDADHSLQAATILVSAQEKTDQLTGEVNAEADRMLDEVRAHCAQLLAEAQLTAQDVVNEARIRGKTMLHDARAAAETLERRSRDKAAALEQDVARKHAEIAEVLEALNQDKSFLENRIDDLRAFEQEYRTQLIIYLQSQLHQLDGPRSAVSADLLRTQQDLVGSGLGARDETI